MLFLIESPIQLLFGEAEQESDIVKNRKKEWLLDSLHENCKDTSKRSKLIDVVVNVMPHWKLDFILEYLKDNQNISGSFYITGGRVDEKLYYYYFIETESGIRQEKIDADKVYIKYTNDDPHIERYESFF